MSVVNMVVGATTEEGATFVTKVDAGGPVRIMIADNPSMTSPQTTALFPVDAQGVVKVTVTGLLSSTRYWWQIEDNGVVDAMMGRFITHPPLGSQASFMIAAAACASGFDYPVDGSQGELVPTSLSNSPVFNTIRQRALDNDWLMFFHLGDLHYYNLGQSGFPAGTIENYRKAYDDVLLQSNQAGLYRDVAWAYVWDDHDYGPNDSNGTLPTKANAAAAFRERTPHYPLSDPSGIWQQWRIGRIQFVASDTRYYRSPNSTPDGGGLILAGTSGGDYAQTPDTGALDLMGGLDARAEVVIDNWNSAAPDGVRGTILGKYTTTGNQRSYNFNVENDGRLSIGYSPDGIALVLRTSTVAVPITSGSLAVRVVFTGDDGSGNNTAVFFTAPTISGPWTQLGSPVVTAGAATIFSGSGPLRIGALDAGTARRFGGVVRRVQLRNQFNTIVANPDFVAQLTGTTNFTDDVGRTWTLFGNAEITNKTMLGTAQKEWLETLLEETSAEVLIWFSPTPWTATFVDTWGGFQTERDELVEMFRRTNWLDRMVVVFGDRHAAGIGTGASNQWGEFPQMQAASLDSSSPGQQIGRFDILDDLPGRGQYGTIGIDDLGSAILVQLSMYKFDVLLGTHQISFDIGEVESELNRERVLSAISGSHEVIYEARIVETFQTGPDPEGTLVDISSGDVTLDGTADVRGKANLTIPGQFGQDGPNAFPRGRDRLVGPFGNEVFIRYGIDFGGGGILWVPLGYYPIYTTDQDDAAYNPIKLDLEDRMSPIIDSKLIDPREYSATTTVAEMFDDLVRDIYPDAVIVFDEGSSIQQLGRQVIVESNRYESMKEVAESLGKIVYFDTEGILRVEAAPDPDELVWQVRAGRGGVLINGRRQISRKGFANAYVVKGEGAGSAEDPVRGIAYDGDPNSPTRFGGPMGKVPEVISTPLVTNSTQAGIAARELLRRKIGAPYNVDFDAITNPLLRPFEAIRIVYGDGTRDIHIIDRVTIPLDEDKSMTAETREKVFVLIGNIQTAAAGGVQASLLLAGA